MLFGFDWLSGFREDWWTPMDGQTPTDDDGRTTVHMYTIGVSCEPNGSGELKRIISHFSLINHRVWLLVRAVI